MKKVIITALALVPTLAFAQNLGGISTLVTALGTIVTAALPIVFGILVLGFFWGLVKFVFAAGDETAQKGAKTLMMYGVIAMFIAASIWGIVIFVRSQLGVGSETTIGVPRVQ